jgi:hypothetical protein
VTTEYLQETLQHWSRHLITSEPCHYPGLGRKSAQSSVKSELFSYGMWRDSSTKQPRKDSLVGSIGGGIMVNVRFHYDHSLRVGVNGPKLIDSVISIP